MQYTNEPLSYSDPSVVARIFGVVLTMFALAVVGHLVNMTFFYVPEPNETPLEGWDLFLGWALGLVISLGAGLFGLVLWESGGSGGGYESRDPEVRTAAIKEGGVDKDILLRMAMTDPEAKVRMAALKGVSAKELYAAADHCKESGEYNCPELVKAVKLHRDKTLLKKASTLAGFKTLSDDNFFKALDFLPKAKLKEYLPHLDGKDQEILLPRFDSDVQFMLEVGGSDQYPMAVRMEALDSLRDPCAQRVFLKEKDKRMREYAIERMEVHGKALPYLAEHLAVEGEPELCQRIVKALGMDKALAVLKTKPTQAAAAAIVEECEDLDALKATAKAPGLDDAVAAIVNERIQQKEMVLAKAMEKIKALKAQEAADRKEAGEIAESTDETKLFSVIENLRAKRSNRVAATVALGKLRPGNNLEIKPGPQPAWHCPVCSKNGDVCMKSTGWEVLTSQYENGSVVTGGVSCPQCSTSHPMTDIVSGKYDVVMVNISCPHCGNPMAGPIDSWINCECMKCGKVVIAK